MRTTRLTVLVAALALALALAPSAAAHVLSVGPQGKIKRIGPLTKRIGAANVADALRAFGKSPAKGRCHGRDSYRAQLTRSGTRLIGANFGLAPRCHSSEYPLQSVELRGPSARRHWTTDRGLRVGDTLARMQELYPGAKEEDFGPAFPGFWTLIDFNFIGDSSPRLSATVRNDQVVKIAVFVGNAGD